MVKGGSNIKKKIIFFFIGLIISILLVFGYHHFLTFKTYSVDHTLEVSDQYVYNLSDITLYPFQTKNDAMFGATPWYYKANRLSLQWRNNLAKVDRFFSFPYDKNSSEIVIKGILLGEKPDMEKIFIEINNIKYKPTQFGMAHIQMDSMTFTIRIKIDEMLKSLQNLSLQMQGSELIWDNLSEIESTRYIISPFLNYYEYIYR